MLHEFGMNAAADGLFHPASTIEAFTEHDAKYHHEIHDTTEKQHSGPRQARSGSEYPPSRENHRLPVLHSGKNKRDRISIRPKSRLQSATSGSAPASMVTTSSVSKLPDDHEEKRSLSATQSDSILYAPRRSDGIPSSADRTALDFMVNGLESDEDNNTHNSRISKSSRSFSALDNNNEIVDEPNSIVPALDLSLAKKFEELKRIMKSNREKHKSTQLDSDKTDECPAGRMTTRTTPKSSARSAIRSVSSGSSAAKSGGGSSTASQAGGTKRSTPVARTATNMLNGTSRSKRVLSNQASIAATRKTSSSVAVAIAPPIRSKREMKVRSGVSLSDLKAEHREALQMLKELGGPVDPDYVLADVDQSSSTNYRLGRANIRATGLDRSTGSTSALAGRISCKNTSNQAPARLLVLTPPTSANSAISMVTKLRESVSSGRSSRESSPRTVSPTISSANKEVETATLSPDASSSTMSSSNETPIEESGIAVSRMRDYDESNAAKTSLTPPPLSPNTTDASDPWKQYEDDDDDNEDEDGENNEQGQNDGSEAKKELTYGDRYSDEDFENDW
ncbi:unnamed protein product [Phytophthora fragariaefolia]|uniref:Unnamed protein product n=1 Tax=Phytophthora fragariaefolia TaxID=1490495 RepID=A0A9W6XXB1_9STRA|nr:unnamed protein product [Phytophthora fragariaefolia]